MDVILFVLGRLVTGNFWKMVGVTFIAVAMMSSRSTCSKAIFEEAKLAVGKRPRY